MITVADPAVPVPGTEPAPKLHRDGHVLTLTLDCGRIVRRVVCPKAGPDWLDQPFTDRPRCWQSYTEDGEPDDGPLRSSTCMVAEWYDADGEDMFAGPPFDVTSAPVPVAYGWDCGQMLLMPYAEEGAR